MTSLLDRIVPGWRAKAQLLLDLVVVAWGALGVTSPLARQLGWTGALPVVLTAVGAWLLTAAVLRLYNPWTERQLVDTWALHLVALAGVATALALGTLTVHLATVGGPDGAAATVQTLAALSLRVLLFRSRPPGRAEDVLVVGLGPLGRATAKHLARRAGRQRISGCLGFPGEAPWRSARAPAYLGSSAELAKVLGAHPVHEVYLAGSAVRDGQAMQAAVTVCEDLGVPFAIPANPFRVGRSRPACPDVLRDGYVHFLSVESKPSQMALKRLMDILVSGVALWALSPLLLVTAALVKLTSPGPVFFRQVRAGLHGEPFNLLKFRSMVANAEALREGLEAKNEQAGPVFKIKADPRVTPLGRLLRRYSIDELPQLVNVLRGDMSLVGPRPPLHSEVAKYQPWQRRRLSVRPGITCYWQVSGRSEVSFDEWMYLDMRYIDHWSLRQDVALILKTVPAVVTGYGAS